MVVRTSPPQISVPTPSGQPVRVAFDGPEIVQDAGLLTIAELDQRLGYLADLSARLPDPRDLSHATYSTHSLLAQQVYQYLADYPDNNDADSCRHDSLFHALAGQDLDPEQPLASRSTLNRFQYAFTRRQHDVPEQQRPAALDMHRARTRRLGVINQFLVDTFIRTRPRPPAYVILDIDASDDPTHGGQTLSGYHGYYQQHQYFPLFVFDGASGFPLAAWLRPGLVGQAQGAVDILEALVEDLRAAWPDVLILVRGDCGMASPQVYEMCERQGLLYALGLGSNNVLLERTAADFTRLEMTYFFIWQYEPHMQRFTTLEDYQADSWSRPRRVVVKLEWTPEGSQRRFVVTNMSGDPRGLYLGFYVQRGAVPEQPLQELKNGLDVTRLSAHGFRANAYRMLLHVVAYGLVVLFRAACASVPEVRCASVGTLRRWLWKVAALVEVRGRVVRFRVSRTWPGRDLWERIQDALAAYVLSLPRAAGGGAAGP